MIKFNKLSVILFAVITMIMIQTPVFAAGRQIEMTGEIGYIVTEGGLYGIIGDDGKKYQPINLPPKLRKNGLPVKFTAEIRDDSFSSVMWGTTIKIQTIKKITPVLDSAQRSAIYVLLKRMEAFNNRDLGQLQKFDTQSKYLSSQQFNDWLANYSHFTLRDVKISFADSTTITGSAVYTRELTNTMTLHDDANITQMNFTLGPTKDGWKIMKSDSQKPLSDLVKIKEQARLKYGTDDLATLWH